MSKEIVTSEPTAFMFIGIIVFITVHLWFLFCILDKLDKILSFYEKVQGLVGQIN